MYKCILSHTLINSFCENFIICSIFDIIYKEGSTHDNNVIAILKKTCLFLRFEYETTYLSC